MLPLNEKEVELLRILDAELNAHGHSVSASTLAKKMQPPINSRVAQEHLNHLIKCRYVVGPGNSPHELGYRIVRQGMDYLAKTHRQQEDGTNVSDVTDANLKAVTVQEPPRPKSGDRTFWVGFFGLLIGLPSALFGLIQLLQYLEVVR